MMHWLLYWGVPALCITALIGVAGVLLDVWSLPYRRWDLTRGQSQIYLRESWKPEDYAARVTGKDGKVGR